MKCTRDSPRQNIIGIPKKQLDQRGKFLRFVSIETMREVYVKWMQIMSIEPWMHSTNSSMGSNPLLTRCQTHFLNANLFSKYAI